LGGFNWSWQHLDWEGCDGTEAAAFGLGWSTGIAVAWAAAGGAA
jgi:hypothetical protein